MTRELSPGWVIFAPPRLGLSLPGWVYLVRVTGIQGRLTDLQGLFVMFSRMLAVVYLTCRPLCAAIWPCIATLELVSCLETPR